MMTDPQTSNRGGISRRIFLGSTAAAGLSTAVSLPFGQTAAASDGNGDDRSSGSVASLARGRLGEGAPVQQAWYDAVYAGVMAENWSPPHGARVYAYVGVASYEAVWPAMRKTHRSLGGQLNGLGELPEAAHGTYDWNASANMAISIVAGALFAGASQPSKDRLTSVFEAQRAARLAAGTTAEILARSEAFGLAIGTALASWLAADGFTEMRAMPAYVPPVGPELWQSTPPNFRPAIEPYWGMMRTMVLPSADACFPRPMPHPYSEDPASGFYQQAKFVYDRSKILSQTEREIATFWTDNPLLTGTPAGHWMQIINQLIDQYKYTLDQAVTIYAMASITLFDAFTACWQAKYVINLVRPITYVRRLIDPTWTTHINTPQFPEYASGHSVTSTAVANVLTPMLGRTLQFVDRSPVPRGIPERWFTSIRAAANEAMQSRVFGGIHYPMGIEMGGEQGDRVSASITQRLRLQR